MTARARHFVPRLLRAPDSAYYLGLSLSRFRELVRDGKIGGRVEIEGNVCWDVNALDSWADSLLAGSDEKSGWEDAAA